MTPLEKMAVRIADLGACQDARDWLEELDPSWTPQQAWDACPSASWMLWLLGRSKQPDKPNIVRVACKIARSVLHLVPAGEDRPRKAIEAAEAWADNPTDAARAAYAARAAAEAAEAAASAAARAAARAADAAAYAAADAAARAAADAASAAADAAADAAAYAADAAACQIVRKFFPEPPELD